MANIELNYFDGINYTVLYPKIVLNNNDGNALSVSYIPNLDTSKITSGTFADARIPSLDASKISSGTFADARIPNLAASKITSGTFSTNRIPTLSASKISEGTFNGAKTGEFIFPGSVRIGGSASSSNAKLRIGDQDFIYLHEDADDHLTIKGDKGINFITGETYNLTHNGNPIGGGSSEAKTYTGTGNSNWVTVSFSHVGQIIACIIYTLDPATDGPIVGFLTTDNIAWGMAAYTGSPGTFNHNGSTLGNNQVSFSGSSLNKSGWKYTAIAFGS